MADIEKIKARIKELEDLAIMKSAATTAYSDAIKASAKECEVDGSLLRKLVSTRIDDKKDAALEESEEFILLLEGIG
jgi:hypothetical protein